MKPFTFKDREKLLKELFAKIETTMLSKGREYNTTDDTLKNFKDRAGHLGMPAKSVCYIDLSKHLDALKNWAMYDQKLTIENADNRMGDAIIYLILLMAIYKQENER